MLRKYICANDGELVEADEMAQILVPSRTLLHALGPVYPLFSLIMLLLSSHVSADHYQGLKTMTQNLTPELLQ